MFSIFVGINKEEPTLEEDPQYFEAQLSGSAKTHKGVLNDSTGHVTAGDS